MIGCLKRITDCITYCIHFALLKNIACEIASKELDLLSDLIHLSQKLQIVSWSIQTLNIRFNKTA